jgi:2-oxoglutarate dehydrogenase E2 component (dihydrolipoamide succinyltransferase)
MSNIVVPQLGESVVEARVAKWLKHEGDHVETGEPVVELETDKIDLEVGADHAGVLSSIKRKEGDDVKVGEVLATVADGAAAGRGDGDQARPPEAPRAEPRRAEPSRGEAASPATPAPEPPRATPTARRMATEHDVDIARVRGSGAAGRVTKYDVKGALAPTSDREIAPTSDRAIAPTSDRTDRRVRMSKRRQTIARRLVEALRTAAVLTTFNEVDMTAVMALRERRKESFKQQYGVGLGITSFFVKASVAALRAFPELNAEIQGDEIVYKDYYDIGIAVGAESGLVVPVIRDADRRSYAQIELAIRDFAARAANGKLTLADLEGGTFTITNGGIFGSLMSTPILNPPQVGILGLHKIQDRAVPDNGQVVIRPMMYVALSYDHRLVDGRQAVQFLVRIKELIEDPANLLLVS